jgi:hypothetical protein
MTKLLNITDNEININLMLAPDRKPYNDWNDQEGDWDDSEDTLYSCDPGETSLEFAMGVISEERELLNRLDLASPENLRDLIGQINDELFDMACDTIRLYEFGMAGIAFALASIGCVPYQVSRDGYEESIYPVTHPWILFHAPVEKVGLLIAASKYAKVQLSNSYDGALCIGSDDVRKFNIMSHYLVSNYAPVKRDIAAPF